MLNNELLVTLKQKWNVPGGNVQFVQESESYVYRLKSGSTESYLRITSAGHRSKEQIIAELEYLLYLNENGLTVSIPIRNIEGNYVESFHSGSDSYIAVLFVPAPGEQLLYKSDLWIESTFNSWGAYLGKMHVLAENYVTPSGHKRIEWQEDTIMSQGKLFLSENNEADALGEFTYLLDEVEKYEIGKEFYGLIHGDLGTPNFRLHNGCITSFDFDDSVFHWFMYDIAVALWPTRFLPDEERNNYMNWFISGYVNERNVDSLWIKRIPVLMRLRNIYMFIYRLKHIDKFTINDKETWFGNMRNSFVRPVEWNLNQFI